MTTKPAPKKIPARRFPEFTGEWEEKPLNTLLVQSKAKNKKLEFDKSQVLSVAAEAGVVNQIEYHGRSYAGESVAPYGIIRKGEMVYTKSPLSSYPYGIIKFNESADGIVSTLYAIYSIKGNASGKFLDYYFYYAHRINRYLKPLVNIGAKNDMKVNNDFVISDLVIVPPLPEQQKIASFLSAVDTRIQQLTRKKALLEQYKKGVMQQIFSQAKRFKDDQGRDFPEWEEKRLGILTYKVGKRNKQSANLPVYSINNKEGFLPQSDQFDGVDSNERGYDTSLYKIVNANTFAYNPARINVGSIGYSGNLNEVIVSSLYVCFKTKQNLDDYYLLAYLGTFEFNKSVLRNAEGGVRSYLFYENFSNIKIPLPSLPEQQKIAAFLSALDVKIDQVGQQLARMQSFKKGLLQQMFV